MTSSCQEMINDMQLHSFSEQAQSPYLQVVRQVAAASKPAANTSLDLPVLPAP